MDVKNFLYSSTIDGNKKYYVGSEYMYGIDRKVRYYELSNEDKRILYGNDIECKNVSFEEVVQNFPSRFINMGGKMLAWLYISHNGSKQTLVIDLYDGIEHIVDLKFFNKFLLPHVLYAPYMSFSLSEGFEALKHLSNKTKKLKELYDSSIKFDRSFHEMILLFTKENKMGLLEKIPLCNSNLTKLDLSCWEKINEYIESYNKYSIVKFF